MELLEALNWRYAVKKLNGQAVPEEKVNNILEAIRLSASGYGLQPYDVIVVSDHKTKGRIHAEACPQPQAVDGSHFLVFANWDNLTDENIDKYIQLTADTRGISSDHLTGFSDTMKGAFGGMTQEQIQAWAARQAYIGLGFGLVAAAAEKVDASPMEGFNPEKLDEILELREKGLKSAVVMALGYRDEENDFLSKAAKVRRPAEEMFIRI